MACGFYRRFFFVAIYQFIPFLHRGTCLTPWYVSPAVVRVPRCGACPPPWCVSSAVVRVSRRGACLTHHKGARNCKMCWLY